MLLRLVVDERLNILKAGSPTRWMSYPGECDEHDDADAQLAGLNLLRSFRHALRERVGGVLGCTHIIELAQVLPTAVVQAFAGEVIDTRGDRDGASPPFQIDRCDALHSDGPAVRTHCPRWSQPTTHDPQPTTHDPRPTAPSPAPAQTTPTPSEGARTHR